MRVMSKKRYRELLCQIWNKVDLKDNVMRREVTAVVKPFFLYPLRCLFESIINVISRSKAAQLPS